MMALKLHENNVLAVVMVCEAPRNGSTARVYSLGACMTRSARGYRHGCGARGSGPGGGRSDASRRAAYQQPSPAPVCPFWPAWVSVSVPQAVSWAAWRSCGVALTVNVVAERLPNPIA